MAFSAAQWTRPIVVPLLATIAFAAGCATSDVRSGGDDRRHSSVRSNESYYAVIDSIESRTVRGGGPSLDNVGGYVIRIRFDDRTFETVEQASLDGLRVGDSVRVEGDRVRRYH